MKTSLPPLNGLHPATSAPFAVDANQCWRSLQKAVSNSHFLKGHGCLLIEQPFPKNDLALSAEVSFAKFIAGLCR
jgi:L-alanine-DL-glutamate epimerase-like enolase superfamily enzyme